MRERFCCGHIVMAILQCKAEPEPCFGMTRIELQHETIGGNGKGRISPQPQHISRCELGVDHLLRDLERGPVSRAHRKTDPNGNSRGLKIPAQEREQRFQLLATGMAWHCRLNAINGRFGFGIALAPISPDSLNQRPFNSFRLLHDSGAYAIVSGATRHDRVAVNSALFHRHKPRGDTN